MPNIHAVLVGDFVLAVARNIVLPVKRGTTFCERIIKDLLRCILGVRVVSRAKVEY